MTYSNKKYMEEELDKTFSLKELECKLTGDVFLIQPARPDCIYMLQPFTRTHRLNLLTNPDTITKAVAFYQTGYNIRTNVKYGHWSCLVLRGKEAFFFDSLGLYPDNELNRIGGDKKRYIGLLLYELSLGGFKIHYNNIKFQKDNLFINTCGRYVILFLNDMMKYPDPFEALKNTLAPYKEAGEKYYDNAIIRYWQHKNI